MARNATESVKPNWTLPEVQSARSHSACPAAAAGVAASRSARFAIGNLQPSRYICGKCGFLEEYVDVPEHLERIRNKYGAAGKKVKVKR